MGKKNRNKNKSSKKEEEANRNKSSKKKEEAEDIDALLETLLELSIVQIFILALEKLVMDSRLQLSAATSIVLSNGRISGEEKDILSNILKNSLEVIEHGHNPKFKPTFTNITKLAIFSLDCLIDMILKHESKPTKKDIIVFLLCSDYFLFETQFIDNIDFDNINLDSNMEKPETGAPCLNIDLGEMLKQLPRLDLEPLLPNTGEGISNKLADFIVIVLSINNVENLQNIYNVCKKIIVEDNVIFEGRTEKRQRELKPQLELEKVKGKLVQINEKKGQLYALFKTEERIYRVQKMNKMYEFNDNMRTLCETSEQKYKDELEKLEHQLSQICSFSSCTRFI